ncbi:hypothetical protein ACTIVE_5545 [Actinomadura verrucosospora]|uniref:Uncharacterized protein n=2 Tax=Actinomadura verrucosospora TaxID=46165 RepID=A0A7D3ZQ93_ACTVE|nr:hypothetical protein ACTIVE_5545 [Actinomadura verrucosospora]
MQPFRIRYDARNWFRDLRDKEKAFSTDFDSFYFCFMAGITMSQKKQVPVSDTAELIANFPEKYSGRGRLLVGLFLTRELEELGVTMDEKRAVHRAISSLVSPDAPNYLSDDGVREFNKYAHGGFDVLMDWFDDRPRTIDHFVRAYKRHVDTKLRSLV